MASFNNVTLVGNLVRDVEFKTVNPNFSVGLFTLGVNERRKDKDGQWNEEANYFECEAFNRTAEILRDYTQKGSPVLVNGRLRQDAWEQEGQKRSKVKIVVDNLVLLGRKSDNSGNGGQSSTPAPARQAARGRMQRAQPKQQETFADDGDTNDIPF